MDRNCSGIVEKDTEKTSRKLEVSLFCFGKEMVNLHLDPVGKKKVFDHLIEIGKMSSTGHIGTHLDCYTCAPDKPEYELSAVVLECKDGMPDAKRLAKLGMLQGKALTLHTGNHETNGYGSPEYFKKETFISEDALEKIFELKPLFVIIDSHGLGQSGPTHVSIDKDCEAHHCHVIENADLSSLKDEKEIRVRINVGIDNPSTGKPCTVVRLD